MNNVYIRGLPTKMINGKFLKNWIDVSDFLLNNVALATLDIQARTITPSVKGRGRYISKIGIATFTGTALANAAQIWIDNQRAFKAGINMGGVGEHVGIWVPPLSNITVYYRCDNQSGAAARDFSCFCLIDEFDSKGMGVGSGAANPAGVAVTW